LLKRFQIFGLPNNQTNFLVDWLIGWLIGLLVGLLVGCLLVGPLVVWLIDMLLC
jgi:hypothetical protein